MKTIVSIALLAFVLAFGAFGQTSVTTSAPPAEPQYSAAVGLGFNHYSACSSKGGHAFETRLAAGTTNVSTLNMTSRGVGIDWGQAQLLHERTGDDVRAGYGGVADGQRHNGRDVRWWRRHQADARRGQDPSF